MSVNFLFVSLVAFWTMKAIFGRVKILVFCDEKSFGSVFANNRIIFWAAFFFSCKATIVDGLLHSTLHNKEQFT